jgi:hypothetical protein
MYPDKVTNRDVDLLARIAGGIYCQHHNYKVSFEGYDGNKPRYGDTAPNALGYLASTLKEHVILQVCKLSDPLKDHRGNENLSIQFFVQHAYFGDPIAKRKLESLGEKLEVFGRKLRPARDKIISHFDRKTIHDGEPLGGADPGEWSKYWSNLDQFVEMLYRQYFNEALHIRSAAAAMDAAILRGVLEERAANPGVPFPLPLPPEV